MSIRPVDMQLIMPRAVEHSAKSAHDDARPNANSQHFAAEIQKQTEADARTVVSAYKPDEGKVNEDGRNKREQEQKKKKRREAEKGAVKTETTERKGLDISI